MKQLLKGEVNTESNFLGLFFLTMVLSKNVDQFLLQKLLILMILFISYVTSYSFPIQFLFMSHSFLIISHFLFIPNSF